MIARAVTLLPQPDSPTRPTIRPASTREGQIVDHPRQAALGVKADRKILDLEQRHRRAQEMPPPSQSSTTRGK